MSVRSPATQRSDLERYFHEIRAAERKLKEVSAALPARAWCHPDLTQAERRRYQELDDASSAYRRALDQMHAGPLGWVNGLWDAWWNLHEVHAAFAGVRRSGWSETTLERVHYSFRAVEQHFARVAASPDARARSVLATYGEPAYDATLQFHQHLMYRDTDDVVGARLWIAMGKRTERLYRVLQQSRRSIEGELNHRSPAPVASARRGGKQNASTVPLRSWKQKDLEVEIRRYFEQRALALEDLERRIRGGDKKAMQEAQDMAGRNAIAAAHGCKSRTMVGNSSLWRSWAIRLQLVKSGPTAPGSRSHQRVPAEAAPLVEVLLRHPDAQEAYAKLRAQEKKAILDRYTEGSVSETQLLEQISAARNQERDRRADQRRPRKRNQR